MTLNQKSVVLSFIQVVSSLHFECHFLDKIKCPLVLTAWKNQNKPTGGASFSISRINGRNFEKKATLLTMKAQIYFSLIGCTKYDKLIMRNSQSQYSIEYQTVL